MCYSGDAMRTLCLAASILLILPAWGGDNAALLRRYQALAPFHQNIRLSTLKEVCREQVCRLEIQERDNSGTFEALLEDTRRLGPRADSPLGRQQRKLSHFLSVHKTFERCMAEASDWTRARLEVKLDRISAHVGNAAPQTDAPPRTLAEGIAQEARQSALREWLPENMAELNGGIARINSLLEDFRRQKREFRATWIREDQGVHPRRLVRRKKNRLALLKRLKEEFFSRYREEVLTMGRLLQTDALRSATGLDTLEEMIPHWWGILGFEKKVLEDGEDFPRLRLVDARALAKARDESSRRLRQQVQSLDKERNLLSLLRNHPHSVGAVLTNHPQYAGEVCSAAVEAARGERNEVVAEQVTYLGLGIGIGVASLATMGAGTLMVPAIIGGAAVGAAFTAGDFFYQNFRAERGRRIREELLASYLARSGDRQSIREIQKAWEETLESDRNAKIALGFGVFDLAVIPRAARVGAFAHLARNLDGIDTRMARYRRLLGIIVSQDRFIKGVRRLKRDYPEEWIGRWLDELSRLPKSEQRKRLTSLAQGKALSPHMREFDQIRKSAEKVLGKKLLPSQVEGVLQAHKVGRGEEGANKLPATIGNYTTAQLAQKTRILKENGYARHEIRHLMTSGVVGEKAIPEEKVLSALLTYQKEFPKLFSESLDREGIFRFLQKQNALMKKLRSMKEFQELEKVRPQKLLVIDIVEKADPRQLRRFEEGLAAMIPSHRTPGYFIEEAQKIVSHPDFKTLPSILAKALMATIEDKGLKRKIFAQLEEGRFDLLEKHLPNRPGQFGFDPKNIPELESGWDKRYYLDILKESFRLNEQLYKLMALHLLPAGKPLEPMDELLLDSSTRAKFVDEVIGNQPDAESLKRTLDSHLKIFGRKLFPRHIDGVKDRAQLKLVEVSPELGIFRGHVGDDCATSCAFGYANSPMARIFIIRNQKGKEMGYLNGVHVTLPNGKRGFFINNIAGANISTEMSDTILAGMEKAKEALGVEEMVILGSRQEEHNINYEPIRFSYQKHRGESVRLSFPDQKIRAAIDQGDHDSVEHLEDANRLANTNRSVTISVRQRDWPKAQTLMKFLEEAEDIPQEQLESIFQTAMGSKHFNEELLETLFRKGFDINKPDHQMKTPWHRYLSHSKITQKGIKYLARQGADIHALANNGDTALHFYASNSHATLKGITYLVDTLGLNIRASNNFQMTPFHLYTRNPNVMLKGIKYFIKKGVSVKKRQNTGIPSCTLMPATPTPN